MGTLLVSRNVSADLSLTTPPAFCCNCGAQGEVEFVPTPLRKTSYFFLFGSEITLNESFPYCRKCRRTAGRVRQSPLSKLLAAGLATAVAFLVLVLVEPSWPAILVEHLFHASALIGVLLTVGYFYVQEWSRKGRTYYQPVSLADVQIGDGVLGPVRLRFYNREYAQVFAEANAPAVAAGFLRVEVRP